MLEMVNTLIHLKSLITKRLKLRQFEASDLNGVHAYASDPEVVKYVPFGPNTLNQTEQFLIKAMLAQIARPLRDYHLAITLKKTGKVIGACRISIKNRKYRKGDIGYCLNRKYWGRGYGREAALALLKFGFSKLKLYRIFATCHVKNIASAKLLERIGMKKVGRLGQHMLLRGKWRDSYLYSILEQEWRREKSRKS